MPFGHFWGLIHCGLAVPLPQLFRVPGWNNRQHELRVCRTLRKRQNGGRFVKDGYILRRPRAFNTQMWHARKILLLNVEFGCFENAGFVARVWHLSRDASNYSCLLPYWYWCWSLFVFIWLVAFRDFAVLRDEYQKQTLWTQRFLKKTFETQMALVSNVGIKRFCSGSKVRVWNNMKHPCCTWSSSNGTRPRLELKFHMKSYMIGVLSFFPASHQAIGVCLVYLRSPKNFLVEPLTEPFPFSKTGASKFDPSHAHTHSFQGQTVTPPGLKDGLGEQIGSVVALFYFNLSPNMEPKNYMFDHVCNLYLHFLFNISTAQGGGGSFQR